MGSTRHSTPCGERGVYRRSRTDKSGGRTYFGKWLPRFKPPREKLASGETLIHSYLPLGGCDTRHAAKTLRDIAAFYYGKAGGALDLGNGHFFYIPSMSEQEKQGLHGMEKVKWVSCQAREVFEDFEKEKAASSIRNGILPFEGAITTASSSVITGTEQLTGPSPDHSTLNQSLENLDSPQFDMDWNLDICDLHALPSLSRGESLRGIPTWPCEGDSNVLTDDVALDVNPILSPQQAYRLKEPHSSTMAVDLFFEDVNSPQLVHIQEQLEESKRQNLELQRQLGETHIRNLELQREMECVKSGLLQRCFYLDHIEYP